jgi:hypothetical protein
MSFKKRAVANRSLVAWAAVAIALLLAAGAGWSLKTSTTPTAPINADVSLADSSLSASKPERRSTEVATAPATVPGARASVEIPPGVASHQVPEIDLRKVQQALEATASPVAAREAASILNICKGANLAAEFAYNQRDHGDATWREQEKRTGVSSEKFIAAAEDTLRRCQVFDSATLARRGELLKRAYEGGVKEAALEYLLWLRTESKQALNPELLGKLQRDTRLSAEDGNFEALMTLSQIFDPTLGVSLMQREAYKEARFLILGETSGNAAATAARAAMEDFEKTMSRWTPAPRALNPQEQLEANALAERVLAAWRKNQNGGK